MSSINKKNVNFHSGRQQQLYSRRWRVPFFLCVSVSISLLSAAIFVLHLPPYIRLESSHVVLESSDYSRETYFVESDLRTESGSSFSSSAEPPRLAYLISGTKGDSRRMMRTLQAVYHPRNRYILHMDLEAPPRERLNLSISVKSDPTFKRVENVRVMAQSNLVTYKGPTMIASTLQAVAVLLRDGSKWDWFINLSASDYPLVTQDGR
ncbi:hypothetical protein M569_17262, partial [Genlisea aurea]